MLSAARVIIDRPTGISKGFGFVEMSSDEAGKKAIAELDQATVEGRTIKVMEARPKEDRPSNSNPFRNKNSGGYKKW